ncbi:MAG: AraC family transcriptional regulator [Synechococcaceae cyanobacterium]|nr:AraC family transcriptional regulator [Synechococcaceae cyanobacterium]
MPALRHVAHGLHPDADSLRQALQQLGTLRRFQPLQADAAFQQLIGCLPINGLVLVSYCGTGATYELEPCGAITLGFCHQGTARIEAPLGDVAATTGEGVLLPGWGGLRRHLSSGETSGVVISLEPGWISRTAAVMAGRPHDPDGVCPRFPTFSPRSLGASTLLPLRSLLHHIDVCAGFDPMLPTRLGLDDVILRLTTSLLWPEGPDHDGHGPRRLREQGGNSAFDELIDFIRSHLEQPLRLSDLEARSFYSRRALQYAFREKLGCTPMQWIREQRLGLAMQRLQSSPAPVSIQEVALGCGYRHTSQFSADFKRRFGLTPSQVRRPGLR